MSTLHDRPEFQRSRARLAPPGWVPDCDRELTRVCGERFEAVHGVVAVHVFTARGTRIGGCLGGSPVVNTRARLHVQFIGTWTGALYRGWAVVLNATR
jgi:hypothetical protein